MSTARRTPAHRAKSIVVLFALIAACGSRTGLLGGDIAGANPASGEDGSVVNGEGALTDAADQGATLLPDVSAMVDVVIVLPDAPIPIEGSAGSCNGDSCPRGCCKGGVCVENITSQECGSFGQECVSCAPGELCKGSCYRPARNCGPMSCKGCCLAPDICGSGISDIACGQGGEQCKRCVPTEGTGHCNATGSGGVCSVTLCDAATCPSGCCSNGVCFDGHSVAACGTAGQQCQACSSNEFCDGKSCLGGTPCTPQNCAGCCSGGNTCLAGNDSQWCGHGGYACQNCSLFRQACVNGACVIPVACTATTCKGCCYGNICAEGDQDFLCGEAGAQCLDCRSQGRVCLAGSCR